MLTLFSIPKPFSGRHADIQVNSVRSWKALGPDVQVILVGNEPGTAEAAADEGATHVPDVATNDRGTPRLDDAFAKVEAVATQPLRCFVNADIVLLDDFLPAVETALGLARQMLMVGATIDVPVEPGFDAWSTDARSDLRRRALASGRSRGATAIDYFVFSPRLFDPVPPFVVGRARFDNWLVWRGRSRGVVIDASDAVVAVHQTHDYSHVPGGHDEAHFGEEAAANSALAGGSRTVYTIFDASHRLAADGRVRRNIGSVLRTRETMRKVAWKLGRA